MFLSFTTFAQTFTLSNNISEKEKTFKKGGFYEIILAENEEVVKNNCCDWSILKGNLSLVKVDSFQMDLKSYEHRMIIDNLNIQNERYAKEGNNFGSFSKHDIFSIKYYKSEK
jgi:hypothetical protein